MNLDSPDLLERLRMQAGCEYISQLREAPFGINLVPELARFDLEQYPLSAWTDAIHYLTRKSTEFHSYDEVARLIARSRQKGRL